jgi:hypothetical protein
MLFVIHSTNKLQQRYDVTKHPTNELLTAVANAVLIVNTLHDAPYSDTTVFKKTSGLYFSWIYSFNNYNYEEYALLRYDAV